MAGPFSQTIQAILSGSRVRLDALVKFDFTSGAIYLWNGNFALKTQDNNVWQGLKNLGSIDGLEETIGSEAKDLVFSVSGASLTDEIPLIALGEDRTVYVDRLVTVYLQFFDEDWQTLDPPYAVCAGLMANISFDAIQQGDSPFRKCTLTAQNIFYNRRQPPYALNTDRDQQLAHPGDIGMSFISTLQCRVVPIPWGNTS